MRSWSASRSCCRFRTVREAVSTRAHTCVHAGWRFPEAQTLPQGGGRSLAVRNQPPPSQAPQPVSWGSAALKRGMVSRYSQEPLSLPGSPRIVWGRRWLSCLDAIGWHATGESQGSLGPGGGGNPPRLEETGYQGQKAQERTASLGVPYLGDDPFPPPGHP